MNSNRERRLKNCMLLYFNALHYNAFVIDNPKPYKSLPELGPLTTYTYLRLIKPLDIKRNLLYVSQNQRIIKYLLH